MSFFEKLSIQGIRCFGPDEKDAGIIKFGLPLTLILGNNGCGKTTIIEALKYATCGDMPPGCSTTQRANFVHDPKLLSRSEVKGQVKLRLQNVKGESVSVTRVVQVTQRALKPQFKSVDQTISVQGEDGTWHSITGRCADADTEMCLALGVSRAVLGNVLLCHQEDSNWPLDEDSKVKAKFDEIFGSDRYNKCLDEIRTSQKRLTSDESKLVIEIKNLKENRDYARKMRLRLEDSELRYAKYEMQISEFDARLRPVQARLKELAQKEDEIVQMRSALEAQKAKLEAVRGVMKDLRQSIQNEFEGSKEELEATIRNFAEELKEKQNSLEALEMKSEEIGYKLNRNQDSLSTEQCRLGQLNGDFEANRKRVETRAQNMLMLSEELGLSTSLSQLSEGSELQRVLSELERAIMQKEAEITVLGERQAEVMSSLQKETSALREKRAKTDSQISGKKDQLKKNKEELNKVKESIFEADRSAELLGSLQTKLDRIKKEYEEIVQSEDVESLKVEISTTREKTRQLDDELTDLDKEVSDLQRMSQVQAKLDVQKNMKSSKDLEIKKLRSRHEDTLKEILEVDEMPEKAIRFRLEARMDQLTDTVKSKSEQLRKMDKDIATKETENRHISQKLKDAKKILEADEFSIKQACNGEEYNVYVTEMKASLDNLQEEKGTLSSSEHFFHRYLQILQGPRSCCPLCKRKFEAQEEAKSLVSELTLKLRDVPSQLRKNKEQLESTSKKYGQLLELKSKYEKVGSLRNSEIPELQKSLERSAKELGSLKSSRATVQEELEAPQSIEAMAKGIHSDVCLLEQLITDSKRLGKEVAEIEEELERNTGTKKTLQEALDEQKEKRVILQQSRKKIDSSEAKLRGIETKKMRLQEEKHSIQDQQFKISGNAQRRGQLSERKDELEGIEGVIQMEIDELTRQLAAVSREIEQSERNTKSTHATQAAEMHEFKRKMKEIEKKFDEINQLNQEILEYEFSGGLTKLDICKQKIERLHGARDELNLERTSLNDQCNRIKSDIASRKTRERDLQDNLSLKCKILEESEFLRKVEVMRRKIGDMNSTSILEERKTLKEQEAELYNTKKEAEGSLFELKKSIEQLKGDLERPHLKYAEKKFCEATVDLEVIIQAKKDLDNFYKALDWAMMSYHQKKIQHINSVIYELWRKVYSGNDIDAIKIHAEQESTACASKRRAFKYRVLQTKCGMEIDMRNRCSAGQKVLACLIIRIALAETFSSHCGVLALDEPTTNLDQDNIINLSKVLLRLVRMQMNRKNFQLIVITHDLDFLNELTRLEGLDHFYKLDRTGEGKSRINKVRV